MLRSLQRCCFYCPDIRTITFLLAYFDFAMKIGNVVFIILSIIDSYCGTEMFAAEEPHKYDPVVVTMTFIRLLLAVVMLGFAVLGLIGLHKKKRNYIKIYIITMTVIITINALLYPTCFLTGSRATPRNMMAYIMTLFLAILTFMAIRNYFKCWLKGTHPKKPAKAKRAISIQPAKVALPAETALPTYPAPPIYSTPPPYPSPPAYPASRQESEEPTYHNVV